MPGSGKTTLGNKLANHLGLKFLDLDHLIEAQEGKPIKDIFSVYGEEYFRNIEKQLLEESINSNDSVLLSTGGGAPCFFNNIEFMLKNGLVIFIDTPIEEIIRRLSKSTTEDRPLVAKFEDDIEKGITDKYNQRIQYYSRAHIKVNGDESLEHIATLINDYN